MKISNFKMVEVVGNGYLEYRFNATIDITTGFFKKKTKTVGVSKKIGGNWIFIDTGKFTPDHDVEELSRSFEAKIGKDLEFWTPEHTAN